MKKHRKCASEPYSSLTIGTILPANDILRLRKSYLSSL